MRWSIRKWLICVLVAMLPLQGMAAATMVFCNPVHHAPVAAAESGHGHGADHHTKGHAHEQAADAPSGDGGASALAGAGASSGDDHSCSACASCCGAAVLPAVPSLESAAPGPARFATLAPKVEPFAGLVAERPPRNIPA